MTDSSEGKTPKLLDRLRQAIRTRHYSPSTEKAYVSWVRRFIFFHAKRHPKEMGEQEVTAFLNHLATKANVSASTQNQALSAILFLYKYVLKDELDWLEGVVRAKRSLHLPVVFTREEAHAVLDKVRGDPKPHGRIDVRLGPETHRVLPATSQGFGLGSIENSGP